MRDYKFVRLQNGGRTIVDADDYKEVSKYRWFQTQNGYAYRQWWEIIDGIRKHCYVFLHRQINQTSDGLFTDHINGNKLDNRRGNLRSATKAQNGINRPKPYHARPVSDYKGVSFHPSTLLWRARLQDGKWIRTTYHKTEEQAALDYNRMAIERFKEYAHLNKIPNWIKPSPVRKKSSQYRGVSFHKKTGRWRAALERGGKAIHLGAFQTEIEAARCYNNGAMEHFGADAKLNQL